MTRLSAIIPYSLYSKHHQCFVIYLPRKSAAKLILSSPFRVVQWLEKKQYPDAKQVPWKVPGGNRYRYRYRYVSNSVALGYCVEVWAIIVSTLGVQACTPKPFLYLLLLESRHVPHTMRDIRGIWNPRVFVTLGHDSVPEAIEFLSCLFHDGSKHPEPSFMQLVGM